MVGSVLHVALVAAAGFVGGAMNALAGGGTFATLPSLLAIGLPANIANATSNVALLPGAATSAWAFRDELGPLAGVPVATLAAITFAGGLVGSLLLVMTPSHAFDVIIPWLVLYAFVVLAFGKRAAAWLHERITIGRRTLLTAQALLGVYGGYFGGGVGLMTTATYGLLAGHTPRELFAPRTLMLAIANAAAAIVFVVAGMVAWASCLPMMAGAILGGWAGARVGKVLPAPAVRVWTLLVTGVTTVVFFWRAYH
ncbi:sulfite exporter TauE/SafE family protein [Sphingomonas sp.]|uniref:sulfite exporter TauE/SafE family protein n=1 Tax=Sphingomonas sp. TaxID=28214 RepID=UPI0025E19A3B|nr:sulfite exporter TauE/SafE family protein [Sphingomonas sp.]